MPDRRTPDPVPPLVTSPARRTRPRARYVVAAVVCAGAIGWMLWAGLSENLVYLRPVSEAVERQADQGTKTFRMGGSVVPGSVTETPEGVSFEITEGGVTVSVVHAGDPPDLFADGAPVVVEGRWLDDETFASERLLIRHGNEYSEYSPPESTSEGSGSDAAGEAEPADS